jgi:hypothetical protein
MLKTVDWGDKAERCLGSRTDINMRLGVFSPLNSSEKWEGGLLYNDTLS